MTTNSIKTFMLMAALMALLMVAGQLMGGRAGLIIALGFGLAMNAFMYWNSDKLALRMSGAVEVSPAEAPELHRIVASLARRAGLPMPRVYVIPTQTPNAFATGRNPSHAAVAVTQGLLGLLNHEEIEGVLAHEMAHIKNRDILVSSVAAVMAGAISSLASMMQWSLIFGGVDDDDDGGSLAGGLVMMIVAPLAASLIQMAISRSREYMADATGAAICGRPEALASALRKLEDYNRQIPMRVNPATAQMYIVNPLTASSLANLFSTHPPMSERIQRLMALARR